MKVTLEQMRRFDFFEETDSPEIVYHMTSRKNAQSIINDGKVKSFGDYVTWFFTDIEHVLAYIYISGADRGRQYYDTNGRETTDPPLNHADTVVLKLACRKEPLMWYKEIVNSSKTMYRNMEKTVEKMWEIMCNIRVCHYGDLRFTKVLDVIELTDIDKLPEPKEIAQYKILEEEMKRKYRP